MTFVIQCFFYCIFIQSLFAQRGKQSVKQDVYPTTQVDRLSRYEDASLIGKGQIYFSIPSPRLKYGLTDHFQLAVQGGPGVPYSIMETYPVYLGEDIFLGELRYRFFSSANWQSTFVVWHGDNFKAKEKSEMWMFALITRHHINPTLFVSSSALMLKTKNTSIEGSSQSSYFATTTGLYYLSAESFRYACYVLIPWTISRYYQLYHLTSISAYEEYIKPWDWTSLVMTVDILFLKHWFFSLYVFKKITTSDPFFPMIKLSVKIY